MTDDIAFMPATRLLALYRSGQLSPVEVIEHILLRLETYESGINAFVLYDPETALALARASEARWQKGEPQGLLDGVPVALKDTLLSRGWPRLLGSRTIDPNQAWDEDAPVPGRLRANGAVFFGKTTTPEFGWKGVTDSPLSGVTRNPWNLERTPGGSSGGSAAAVLAGIGPLAVGTDAGGSIRIPAAFCGIVGHKPTFGRVAAYPPSAFGDVAHVGPLTRTVDDAALMLDAMKGPDSRDWHSLLDDGIVYRERVREGAVKGKRIALSPTLGYAEPAPAVRAAVERTAQVFAELGAVVEEARPVLGIADADFPDARPRRLLGIAAGAEARSRGADGSRPRRNVPARRGCHPGAIPRGGRATRGAGTKTEAVLRPFRSVAGPNHADPGGLRRPAHRRVAEPKKRVELGHLYLRVQPDQEPVLLDTLRFCGWAADRVDGEGPLYEDLGVLQASRAYEEAAGAVWPSPELSGCLDKISRPADAAVKAKIPANGSL
jgi:Asp-tRNA(Asn)/Glu-tRNA(Gln) amidotransferase A subunit family amidase